MDKEGQCQGRAQNLFGEPRRKHGKSNQGFRLSHEVRESEEQQREKEHKDVKVQ